MPQLPLVFDQRIMLAHVLYYGDAKNEVIKWNPDPEINDHYELTTQLTEKNTPDVLLVIRSETVEVEYGPYFNSFVPLATIDVPQGHRQLKFNIVRANGFRGYGRQ